MFLTPILSIEYHNNRVLARRNKKGVLKKDSFFHGFAERLMNRYAHCFSSLNSLAVIVAMTADITMPRMRTTGSAHIGLTAISVSA